LGDNFAEACHLPSNLVAASGQSVDQLLAAGIEELAQIARAGRQCSLERLAALPERAFEFAKAARQGHANFIDPLGETFADLSGAPG
jgi:hypothetical protein